jgi:hypothetical protein
VETQHAFRVPGRRDGAGDSKGFGTNRRFRPVPAAARAGGGFRYVREKYQATTLLAAVRPRAPARTLLALGAAGTFAELAGVASAHPTNLQETNPILWVMMAISVAGAIVTYAFLAYAIWRYRDPHTRGRRYG